MAGYAVRPRREGIAALAAHRGGRVVSQPATFADCGGGGLARRAASGGDRLLALGRPREPQDVRVEDEGGGEEQLSCAQSGAILDGTNRGTAVARLITSETIFLFGRRYRLMPPGTYRSDSAWWLDWHDGGGRRRRCSSWTADFEEAKRFAYNLASGMTPHEARSWRNYLPAAPSVAREMARTDGEFEMIKRWLPPVSEAVASPVEIIAGAIAGMPPDAAIQLLRRMIRRIA